MTHSRFDAEPEAPADLDVPPVSFAPTPFRWREPSTFPRRAFVYGRHYARQYLGVTAAQTKVGKSSLVLGEAVAMASRRNLLGVEPDRKLRVWYWNGEDPREEIERRVLAICQHYGVDHHDVEQNLCIDSGRDTEIIIASQTKTRAVIATPVEDALTAALLAACRTELSAIGLRCRFSSLRLGLIAISVLVGLH